MTSSLWRQHLSSSQRLIALLCGLIFASSLQATQAVSTSNDTELPNPFENIEAWHYPNGLHVFFKAMPNSEIITYRMTLATGARQDPEGREGLAHFVEHMLFTGAKGRKKAEFESLIDQRGGENNASTSLSATDYWLELPAKEWEFGLQWFEELLFDHKFAPQLVDEERRAVILERDLKPKTPADYLSQWVFSPRWAKPAEDWEKVLGIASDTKTTIGTWEAVQAINTKDIQGFYDRWYGPQNMTITLIGNFNRDQVKAVLDKRFASKARFGEDAHRVLLAKPKHQYKKHYGFDERGGHNHKISQFIANIDSQDFMWLLFLKDLMAEELNQELRQEKQAAYGVGVQFHTDRGQARLQISGNFDPSLETESLAFIEQLYRDLSSNKLSAENFETLRKRIIASRLLNHQSPWQLSNWAKSVFHNREIFNGRYPDIIDFYRRAEPAQLAQWMQQRLDKNLRMDSTIRPAPLWGLAETCMIIMSLLLTFSFARRHLIEDFNFNDPVYTRKILYGPATSIVGFSIALGLIFIGIHGINLILKQISSQFISGFDSYSISLLWSNICAVIFALFLMAIPSLIPRKIMLQNQSWRIKHLSYRSRVLSYKDIIKIKEGYLLSQLCQWRGWPCRILHWNPCSKGIYIQLQRGSYFLKSRDNQALLAEFQRHLKTQLQAIDVAGPLPQNLLLPLSAESSKTNKATG